MLPMDLFSELKQIIHRINPAYPPSTLNEDTALLDERVLDSLQIVSLICEIEATFGVRVSLDEVVPENFESLRKISDLVNRLI